MVEPSSKEELDDNAGLQEEPAVPVETTEPMSAVESSDEFLQLSEELRAAKDQRLRIAAEFENFRRRMNRQRAEWPRRARADVVKAMLPVLDDFDRSLEAAESAEGGGAAFTALREGVDLVLKNFWERLEGFGLARIDAEGQPFDENLHEAIMQTPAPEGVGAGTVLQEVQRGYRMGELVLRHAQVIVAAPTGENSDVVNSPEDAAAKVEAQ